MEIKSRIYSSKASSRFYPQDEVKLRKYVQQMLALADDGKNNLPVKAIIAPQAPYVYSGLCAANAYKFLDSQKNDIKRVVLLASSNNYKFNGIAVPFAEQWQTPLGSVALATKELHDIVHNNKFISFNDTVHEYEYSLDIQIPFLQEQLSDFELLPFLVGEVLLEDLKALIESLWGNTETLVIISSDLSRMLSDSEARIKDANTAKLIESSRSKELSKCSAGGYLCISALLDFIKKRNVDIKRVELCNSSDAIGGAESVVGYGSWVFVKRELNSDERIMRKYGNVLITSVTSAIKRKIETGIAPKIDLGKVPTALHALRPTCVTIELGGKIIATKANMSSNRPLIEDVVENAISALESSEIESLAPNKFDELMVTVSLLSPMVRLNFSNEQELLDQLVPHYHGLLIQDKFLRKTGSDKAVFLPHIWNAVSEPKQFLDQLKVKAGLPAAYWGDDIVAWKFSLVKTSGFMKNEKVN